MTKKTSSFETSFSRLEEILEKMNSGSLGLEDSLKLYEEADALITNCSQQLNHAEKKIEELIKKRNGNLETSENETVKTQEFSPK